jgi:predicted glycosyltransferase
MIHTKSINRIVNYIIENIGKRNNGIELEDPTDLMFEKVCEYLKR